MLIKEKGIAVFLRYGYFQDAVCIASVVPASLLGLIIEFTNP